MKQKDDYTYQPKLIEQSIHTKDLVIQEMVRRYKAKGIKREWIAEALDIPASSMLRIERGTYKLSFDRFLAMCAVIEEDPVGVLGVAVGDEFKVV